MKNSNNSDNEHLIDPEIQRRNNLKVALIAVGFGILCVSLLTYGFMSTLDLKGHKSSSLDDLIVDDNLLANSSSETTTTTIAPVNTTKEKEDFTTGVPVSWGGPQCVDVDFGYLVLAVRWPIGACEDLECIPKLPKEWKIHGLWPNFNNNSWPEYCCDRDKFNMSQVESLRPKLEKNWLNIQAHKDPSSLWVHEWEKHGTCSTKNKMIRGEYNYFKQSLDLFIPITVDSWLNELAITPGTQVHRNNLKDRLKKKFGKAVTVHCVSEHKSPNAIEHLKGHPVLESIHFCYDKDRIEPIDCPDRDSCPTIFLYPDA